MQKLTKMHDSPTQNITFTFYCMSFLFWALEKPLLAQAMTTSLHFHHYNNIAHIQVDQWKVFQNQVQPRLEQLPIFYSTFQILLTLCIPLKRNILLGNLKQRRSKFGIPFHRISIIHHWSHKCFHIGRGCKPWKCLNNHHFSRIEPINIHMPQKQNVYFYTKLALVGIQFEIWLLNCLST